MSLPHALPWHVGLGAVGVVLFSARILAAIIVALTLAAAVFVHISWQRSQADAFEAGSKVALANIEMVVDRASLVVRAVQALYADNPHVTQAQFERFVPTIGRVAGVRGVAYYPLVNAAERESFEARLAAEDLSPLGIWEMDAQREPVRAGARDLYLPVAASYVFFSGRLPHGYDILSDPERSDGALAAVANGYGSSTNLVRFVSAPDEQEVRGIVMYRPVLSRTGEVIGLASGSIEIQRLLQGAVRASARVDSIDLRVGEAEPTPEPSDEPRIVEQSAFSVTYENLQSGRPWYITISGSPPLAETIRGYGVVALVLLAGFGAAAAIHGYGKAARRGRQVRAAQRKLRRTLDGLEPLVWMTTADGDVVEVNRAASKACGLAAEQVVGSPIWDLPIWKAGTGERKALEAAVIAAAGGADRRLDVAGIERDGIEPVYDVSIRPIAEESGPPAHLAVSALDVTERVQASATLRLIMRELDHRMKNTLQVIQGIIRRTARAHGSVDSFEQALLGRIGTMARAHGLLAEERWMGADLRSVILQELESFDESHSARVSGPPLRIHPRGALAFSMAVHELGTNATKYGALSVPQGRVAIDWVLEGQEQDRTLIFTWRESNGPRVEEPTQRGFGSLLLERSLAYDLDGQTEMEFHPEGVVCRITLPWDRVKPAMAAPGSTLAVGVIH